MALEIPVITPLRVDDHSRDVAGLTYVYPVVSRRAGGVSLGINLNPNNACNWRCVYCQVPDLQRGPAPDTLVEQLEQELDLMLNDIVHGDFMLRAVPEGARRLNDIAFSGNG
ncbi:MAG: radical SAM protein, partial [Deefgea sp.]